MTKVTNTLRRQEMGQRNLRGKQTWKQITLCCHFSRRCFCCCRYYYYYYHYPYLPVVSFGLAGWLSCWGRAVQSAEVVGKQFFVFLQSKQFISVPVYFCDAPSSKPSAEKHQRTACAHLLIWQGTQFHYVIVVMFFFFVFCYFCICYKTQFNSSVALKHTIHPWAPASPLEVAPKPICIVFHKVYVYTITWQLTALSVSELVLNNMMIKAVLLYFVLLTSSLLVDRLVPSSNNGK